MGLFFCASGNFLLLFESDFLSFPLNPENGNWHLIWSEFKTHLAAREGKISFQIRNTNPSFNMEFWWMEKKMIWSELKTYLKVSMHHKDWFIYQQHFHIRIFLGGLDGEGCEHEFCNFLSFEYLIFLMFF